MTRLLGLAAILAASLFLIDSAIVAQDGAKGVKKGKIAVETLFKKLDVNKDGKLTKDEFLRLADNLKNKDMAREKLTTVFSKIDPESKGVTLDQFRDFIESKRKEKSKS